MNESAYYAMISRKNINNAKPQIKSLMGEHQAVKV